MKLFTTFSFILTCTVSVVCQSDLEQTIPKGSSQLIAKCSLKSMREAFVLNEVFSNSFGEDQGFETETVELGNGTRSKYKVFMLDSTTVKIIPYWSITERVQRQYKIAAGGLAAPDTNFQKAVFKSKSHDRPRAAFLFVAKIATETCSNVEYK